MTEIALVNVFTLAGQGGNPCPIVPDAAGLDAAAMQGVARRYGHESGFVLPPETDGHDFAFRFYVPNHEMEMCAHATIGALWVLARRDRLPGPIVHVETRSGSVTGFVDREPDGTVRVAITQPAGRVAPLTREAEEDVLAALGIGRDALADRPLRNAATARVKTLVPMRDPAGLDRLAPEMAAVEAACRRIGSTGLYPYATADADARRFEARQFPRSSGYREDAATGIAAAALAFGLLRDGAIAADDRTIRIVQGRAMGHASEIRVRLGFAGDRAIGCLLSGDVAEGEA